MPEIRLQYWNLWNQGFESFFKSVYNIGIFDTKFWLCLQTSILQPLILKFGCFLQSVCSVGTFDTKVLIAFSRHSTILESLIPWYHFVFKPVYSIGTFDTRVSLFLLSSIQYHGNLWYQGFHFFKSVYSITTFNTKVLIFSYNQYTILQPLITRFSLFLSKGLNFQVMSNARNGFISWREHPRHPPSWQTFSPSAFMPGASVKMETVKRHLEWISWNQVHVYVEHFD